jgi:hypothetical protein
MGAFSADWLALREPADVLARSSAVVDAVRGKVLDTVDDDPLSIIDLGAGTGANLRYVAPRIGGRQDWLLVDSDRTLLAVARTRLLEWASTLDAQVETRAGQISIVATSFSATVRTQELDMARQLASLRLPRGGLVTASALLDLVSQRWLDALADACRGAHANVLFALTYDGRMTLAPAEPDDALARALFDSHQRTDKGFGPALGPAAAEAAKSSFAKRGYAIKSETSDWRLGGEARELQGEHLEGWLRAACEIEPKSRATLERWHVRHRQRIDAGESRILVGHSDFAGLVR